MKTTTPTAAEQFIEDYLLVAENDADTWNTLQEYADEAERISSETPQYANRYYILGVRLKNEWEDAVATTAEGIDNEAMSLMVRQMLIGYGVDTFYKIAQRVFLARN